MITLNIDEFAWDKAGNILMAKKPLYSWGQFPLKLYIVGKKRTVQYNYAWSDTATRTADYIPEDNIATLPKLVLVAKHGP